jgi:hypothetical protein
MQIRYACAAAGGIQRVRQSAFRLFHAVWRVVPPHGSAPTGFRASALGMPLHAKASRAAVPAAGEGPDALCRRPLER